MQRSLRSSAVVPLGFEVDSTACGDTGVLITVRHSNAVGRCPSCGGESRRVHSRYRRRLADLPISGRCVQLTIVARRFYCDTVLCGRRIFTERFESDILAPWARRTARLDHLVHHLGLALGGRPAAALAKRLLLPVSNDTLLRVVRRKGTPAFSPPSVVGIDDWAWRRNCRYGTIICDLERRRTIALLPDREPATAQDWLSAQPQITLLARDRGGGYALAGAKALPNATQVADRWHLMANASQAFLDAVRKSMRQIRQVIGSATVNPDLLTSAQRIQYEGYLRREETNAVVTAMAKDGLAIKEIVRRTGHSRKLVRSILRGQRSDIFRVRENSLELYLPWLDTQWESGCRNAGALWRLLREQGFRGSRRVVGEWATRRRRAETAAAGTLTRVPAARTIARLLTIGRDTLSKAETVTVAAIEAGIPDLVEARRVVAVFQSMISKKSAAAFETWVAEARASLVAAFANGVLKDKAAILAAISSPWSNGQTEGQITKLKLVKRQMYGRGKLDLLQARVIGASPA